MTRHGTCHYETYAAANRAYRFDCETALAEGRICVGAPEYDKDTQFLSLDADRRYWVNDAAHPIGMNWRTLCGNARVSYHPEWSPSRPFAIYVRGDAIISKETLQDAAEWLGRNRRMVLNTTEGK